MQVSILRSLLLLNLSFLLVSLAAAHTSEKPYAPDKSLEFIQNRNQWNAKVKYKANLPGGQLYLKQTELVFNFQDQKQLRALDPHHASEKNNAGKAELVNSHAYAVRFLGASKQASIEGNIKTPGHRNYFIGNDPAKWASEVAAFQQTQYHNLYPGTDLKFYEFNNNLKYDFILKAGANPDKIKLQYTGAENLSLQEGKLVIKTSVNTVTEQKPYSYQVRNGKAIEVPCEYRLKDNIVSFAFPKGFDKTLPLTIDPTLVFSSYSGSFADNWGFTATYDNAGNLYSGGAVFAAGYPTTFGAYQANFRGAIDIGIIKYNSNAAGPASRIYATYLGGTQTETPHSLVVNSQDELLILATSSSANYPTSTNAYDRVFNSGFFLDPFITTGVSFFSYDNGSDLVISKLGPTGNTLLASTFLGGGGNEGLMRVNAPLTKNYGDQFRGDILTDAADNVYIASSTNSANFPLVNAFQNTYGGGTSDAVICKLSPDLNNLLLSSYYGGAGDDASYSVQVDDQFNVYFCGGTTSSNLAQTAGGLKPTNQFGQIDGFITKVGNTGQLLQATYIGAPGTGYDQTYFVQLDGLNNVYVLGQSSGDYPVFAGTNPPATFYSKPNSRQFIQKLTPNLRTGIFSTSFGTPDGKFNISPTAFLVDNCERIFVCGWGGSINSQAPTYVKGNVTGMDVSVNALKPTTDGSDFYLMQLSQHAAKLEYATFLGGNDARSAEHVDGGTSRFDKRGFVYQAVCAGCQGTNAFPTTPNAWSTTNKSSNCNNAAFKFDFAVTSAVAGNKQAVCANAPAFQVTGATPPGGVWSGNGVTAGGIFTPSPALVGTHVLTYTVTVGTCVSRSTKAITVSPVPQVSFTGLNPLYCPQDQPVTLTPSIFGGTFSGPGILTNNQWSPAAAGPGKHVISYSYSDANSCQGTATDTVVVAQPITVLAGPDEGTCALTEPFQLAGASPAGGAWSGPGVSPTGLFTPASVKAGKYTLTYTVTAGACTYEDTKIVAVDPVAEINVKQPYTCSDANDSLVSGYTPFRISFMNNFPVGRNYFWDFGDGTTSTEMNPEHTYTKGGDYAITLRIDYDRECVRTNSITTLKVIDSIVPNIITPNGDKKNDSFIPKVTCLPLSFKLYSRWGTLVHEEKDYSNNFNGDNLNAGLYYYLLKDPEGKTWKGWLEIMK